MIQNMVQIISP